MRRDRKIKILATLGPASSDVETISLLHQTGVDVFRINMSHSTHDTMRSLVQKIRSVEAASGRPIGILADLQGPKLRVGTFIDGSAQLRRGQNFTFDRDERPGDDTRVHLPHPEIFEGVRPGHRLLIDDGKLALRIIECGQEKIVAEVMTTTNISNRKGVSLPDTFLPVTALTDKDRRDLEAIMATDDIEWIGLSFIQQPSDLDEVRAICGNRVGLLAKIEKSQTVERLEEIIERADAVMVARGDLGVEMPLERVPGVQKQIVRACRQAGKPVVVATQMMESMITAPAPTRAEVSDVATAVFDGADAIMLSAESASGQFPFEAVAAMASIARTVEVESEYPSLVRAGAARAHATREDAISLATRQIAETLQMNAIVTYTTSGSTGLRVARERPMVPIVALSPLMKTARRLAIVWGIHAVVTEDAADLDDVVTRASGIALQENFARPGERIIITAGVPLGTPAATNMVRIADVVESTPTRVALRSAKLRVSSK